MSPLIRVPKPWEIPERLATPEDKWSSRRTILKTLGIGSIGALVGCNGGCGSPPAPSRPSTEALSLEVPSPPESRQATAGSDTTPQRIPPGVPEDVLALYPVDRNDRFTLDRPLTPEEIAGQYNNYYEFTTDKERVAALAADFPSRPWAVEVTGLCHEPATFDIDDLHRSMPLEERLYRFRCVEAWSMAVPWTGFRLGALLDRVRPKSDARFVRFVSFDRPNDAVGQRTQDWYPWPYFEGLTMDEARSELTLLATGIYGHPLPNQHGAPVRLVVPWKYGFKSAKGIVRIELTADEPPTFWSQLAADEYTFEANVEPDVPHPRWSQATERDIATGNRRPTLPYNGYGDVVASLYRR